MTLKILVCLLAFICFKHESIANEPCTTATNRPNIVFILTDDHRWDAFGASDETLVRTPNIDRIAKTGMRFSSAFVTLSICSPSRAACLTGRYGSSNGVTSFGSVSLADGEVTFANRLQETGYATGVTGKWHLKTSPADCGFEFASTCWSNGTWYDRKFTINGKRRTMPGFVDDVAVDEAIRFVDEASQSERPFALWLCTQVPHMDHKHSWPAKQEFHDGYDADEMKVPVSWNDELIGKPEYLKTGRNRTRGLEYGYDNPERIQEHIRDYYAGIEQMDQSIGRFFAALDSRGLSDNTWFIFMGDNGWLLGEHGMTSKVLPYEESMRVPMAIAGPNTKPMISNEMVLNIDLTATIYDIAGLPIPGNLHGRSLLPIVNGQTPKDWRTSFLYEAPTSQLGSQPLWALRNHRWKFIETHLESTNDPLTELYDLKSDKSELNNLATDPRFKKIVVNMASELAKQRSVIDESSTGQSNSEKSERADVVKIDEEERTDLFISGVYPHLTTYGIYSQNGGHYKSGHNECGIGAVVPWAGKLWMVNYAPHMPKGSEHKLYAVNSDLTKPMEIHPDSVGGTPAGRMIHAESNQLLIAHYLIDAEGNVRTIQPKTMPIRVTAIARHLEDPTNKVYYVDMEGSIWEANVHTLEVKQLFKKPVPGWHGKGGYTSQGRLVVSNNGELHVGDYADVLVGGKAKNEEERGVLAEWDGTQWKIVERRQYTEVTGPSGITGGSDGNDPIWAVGWDHRSVRFKVLDDGKWHTYLLPKAAYCNDASHGWYTEWPRIREITGGRWMMDMHGMFFDFPKSFSTKNSKGLSPIGSHLRYVPDFCDWNGRLVLATDETSIQGNKLAGQPQSNLWFGDYEDLKNWGPASGYGGPWIDDAVTANTWSDPFLISGFKHRTLHLANGRIKPVKQTLFRTTDQQKITQIPDLLADMTAVTANRGNWREPAPGFEFTVDESVKVFLAVDKRGQNKQSSLDDQWKLTDMEIVWGKGHRDLVYVREFKSGRIRIPGNSTEHTPGSFGMPHMAMIQSSNSNLKIKTDSKATVRQRANSPTDSQDSIPVTFTIQLDENGTNHWTDLESITLDNDSARSLILPADLEGVWIRIKTNRDCVATAFLHQTSEYPSVRTIAEGKQLFSGLANLDDKNAIPGLIYAAKRNRNLRMISNENRQFEFTKSGFQFERAASDQKLEELLRVEPEFEVDNASVIIHYQGNCYRLPKGNDNYDQPFRSGWPRAVREVESERELANIHGTFYELPLITNGAPPAWNLVRPVSSHQKQITDFCTWNGLLVLAGVKNDAADDGHVFRDSNQETGLWFGGIDDLWKLGKPIGDGGPWLNSPVEQGSASDPYLMRGYDKKRLTLSHAATENVTFTIQIDIDGHGHWVDYQTVTVAPNEEHAHSFPEGFSACWIRFIPQSSTTASAQLKYR